MSHCSAADIVRAADWSTVFSQPTSATTAAEDRQSSAQLVQAANAMRVYCAVMATESSGIVLTIVRVWHHVDGERGGQRDRQQQSRQHDQQHEHYTQHGGSREERIRMGREIQMPGT
jgi:hypothetical protein